jgi:mono/diheme cytochrome c family protein
MNWRRIVVWVLVIGVALFVAIQLVPYGRDHSNPPVTAEPDWDSPRTRELAQRACFDCHSNETVWPWYSNIAPPSWMLQRDVENGRSSMNFSEWPEMTPLVGEALAEAIREQVEGGGMPPRQYLLMHGDAKLSDAEKTELVEGMMRTLAPGTSGERR